MVLLDVNVLVTAMREDAPRHQVMKDYLERLRRAPEPFGVSELVLSAALRVLTHPRVFVPATPLDAALAWISALRATPNIVLVGAGIAALGNLPGSRERNSGDRQPDSRRVARRAGARARMRMDLGGRGFRALSAVAVESAGVIEPSALLNRIRLDCDARQRHRAIVAIYVSERESRKRRSARTS